MTLDFLHGTHQKRHCCRGQHAGWQYILPGLPGVHRLPGLRDSTQIRPRCWAPILLGILRLNVPSPDTVCHSAIPDNHSACDHACVLRLCARSSHRHGKTAQHLQYYGNVHHTHSQVLDRHRRCLQCWAQSFQIPYQPRHQFVR